MPVKPEQLFAVAVFLPPAIIVLWLFVRRGTLSPHSLDAAPPRAVSLTVIDLGVAFLLFFAGVFALSSALRHFGYAAKLETRTFTPEELATVSLLQHAIQAAVVLYLLIRVALQPRGWREWGLVPRSPGREVKLGLLALLAAVPLVMGVTSLVVVAGEWLGLKAPATGHEMLKVMTDSPSPVALAMLLVSAVILAPLMEETIFRGLVQTVLKDYCRDARWTLVLVSALIFTVIHLSSSAWQVMPGLFVLGVMLGWLYERTGSLLPGLLLHVGFNAVNSAWALMSPPQP